MGTEASVCADLLHIWGRCSLSLPNLSALFVLRVPVSRARPRPPRFLQFKLDPEEDWCCHQGNQERSGPLSCPFGSRTDTPATISRCFASRGAPGRVGEVGVGWPEHRGLNLEPGPRAVLGDKFSAARRGVRQGPASETGGRGWPRLPPRTGLGWVFAGLRDRGMGLWRVVTQQVPGTCSCLLSTSWIGLDVSKKSLGWAGPLGAGGVQGDTPHPPPPHPSHLSSCSVADCPRVSQMGWID